jgi:septum formation protein
MSKPEIEYYIDVFKPYDKAGAYGIQDWIGLCKVKEIRGSYSNIMGLPMNIVYTMLEKYLTKA